MGGFSGVRLFNYPLPEFDSRWGGGLNHSRRSERTEKGVRRLGERILEK